MMSLIKKKTSESEICEKVNERIRGFASSRKKKPCSKLLMHHVLAKRGKNKGKILNNPALKTEIQEVTIAYKWGKVKKVLRRDGRLLNVILKKNSVVSRVEYDKVKTMKKLMELSYSVCQVRINGSSVGSGFLLFDKFVLTNAHVIENISNDVGSQLYDKVTVHFSNKNLEQSDGGLVMVEEVVGFEYRPDVSPYDWALLRLSANENLPRGLLTHFGFLPKSGEICFIGHSDGAVKKIDPCLIIPIENRINHIENQGHTQLATQQFMKQVLMYMSTSSSYFGSSGSPVFDKDCNVVAVHSGGYTYPDLNEENSVIVMDYGLPLSDIMERIIIQMVERGRCDVLKALLDCNFAQCKSVFINVKKLVESRNLTTFKSAVHYLVNINDKSLKMLFEFFAQVEEPVPMETECAQIITKLTADKE